MTTPATSRPFGVNLYGYLTSNVGLGVAARNTLRMLLANGVPVRTIDLDPGGGLAGTDVTMSAQVADRAGEGPFAVNLFHINPDRLRYLISPWEKTLDLAGRLNVCVPFWEAPRLPRAWLPTLSAMDLVLAPSLFIRDAVAADLPDVPVAHYPQTAMLPTGVRSDRQRWGIPDDVVAFVTSFAVASDVERKNPWATIEAFDRAFRGDTRALLVVKVNNPGGHAASGAAMRRLQALCDARPTVRLVTDPLAYADVLGLYSSCDVVVSLHRSEGLGLSLLEGMMLGKPALGTAWSGNMDFMTPEDSALVPYRLVDIDVPRSSPYHPRNLGVQTQWAEADVDAAAEWMVRLADDAELRDRLGAAGRAAAEAGRGAFEGGAVIPALQERLALIDAGGRSERAIASVHGLRARYVPDYGVRIARGIRRRIEARFPTEGG
jgi:glycosyltransferase involved in cell wall biosynthesis